MTHLDPDRLADRALGTDDPLTDRCPHCHCGEHDVRSDEQLGNRGRGVRETPRIDHGGLWRPDDADHGGHAVRLDQGDFDHVAAGRDDAGR